MHALNQAIRLRVVRSCRRMADAKQLAEGRPERAGELSSSITRYCVRNPEPLDPPMEECESAVGGGGGRQRNCFRPAGSSVDYCKKERVSRGDWQGSYQVYMEVGKTAVRDRYHLRLNEREMTEKPVHEPLEGLRRVGKTKWHEQVLKKPKGGDDRRFRNIGRIHRDLVVPLDQVDTRKILTPVELCRQVQNRRKRVLVVSSCQV